ncbi:MAG: Bug family tripartite tricarboxylate transporter substrate binding protein [Candidatus Binatia bacterium]
MKKKLLVILFVLISFTFFDRAATGATAAEFYRGKIIRFIVGYSPGGGFDTYTRLIARHFGKHVPGNPSTLVQNMTGAGTLISANYLYSKAKRDGLTIGNFISPLLLEEAMGNKAVKFNGRKFGWLGVPSPDNQVCALTKASGIRTVEDWFKSKRIIKVGSAAVGGVTSVAPKLLKVAIGLPMRVIVGYRGTAKIRLAAEGGEIDGGCWSWQSIKATWRKGLDSGNVRIVLQLMLKSHPELKRIPLAISYAKTKEARQLLTVINDAYGSIYRPYAVPPGTPKTRLRVLQKAFMETLRDPELLGEAKRSKLEIAPINGQKMAKTFASFYRYDPGLLARIKEIIKPKK